MSDYQNRIISDYKILLGKPVIKDTRISVEFLLKKLSEGASVQDLVKQHQLHAEDIYAALDYASARLGDREERLTKK